MLSDPIKYISTRPSTNLSISGDLATRFRKALYIKNFSKILIIENGDLNTIHTPKYRIDLDINQAHFNNHHTFSAEHRLCFKLKSMYRHYQMTQEQNLSEILTVKLKALREAQARFIHELNSKDNRSAAAKANGNLYIESNSAIIRRIGDNVPEPDKDGLVGNDTHQITPANRNKIIAYRDEIKQTRQQRDIEMQQKKTLIEKIVETWKELKDLRNNQKFRNTDIKLIIKKKNVDREAEESALENDLKNELDELLEEENERYAKEIAIYNKNIKAYKFQRIKKNEAKKREKIRETNEDGKKDEKNPEEPVSIFKASEIKELEENDWKILNEENLVKPIQPEKVDEIKIKKNLREKYERVRKVPGEPLLSFDLIEESGSITITSQCSTSEQKRRNLLASIKVYAKIFFNGKLVYTTNESQLQNDFSVKWGQIFNIYMLTSPESIQLQLFEYSGNRRSSNDRFIAEINIPTPETNCTSANYILEDYEFTSNKSGPLMFTSGKIRTGAGWAINPRDGTILIPPNLLERKDTIMKRNEMKNFDAVAALGVSRMQDMEKLSRWVAKSNLDPNDPRNSDLFNLIRAITDSDGIGSAFDGIRLPDYFRIDEMMDEFNFTTDEEIEKNKRFRLISLRTKGEPEFRGEKMIPSLERYISKGKFAKYEERMNKTTKLTLSRPIKGIDNEIDAARFNGQQYLQSIRQHILSRYKFAQNQKTLADMVIEDTIPNIK
jgi:coiled-coil and C2 domain-containing protein 2A